MRRLSIVTEAQPIDPVRDAVLLVDGLPAQVRPRRGGSQSIRIPTLTASRDGRQHSVNVTLTRTRWSLDEVADTIARDVLEAAESAGLDIDPQVVRREARRAAKREVGLLRWLRP